MNHMENVESAESAEKNTSEGALERIETLLQEQREQQKKTMFHARLRTDGCLGLRRFRARRPCSDHRRQEKINRIDLEDLRVLGLRATFLHRRGRKHHKNRGGFRADGSFRGTPLDERLDFEGLNQAINGMALVDYETLSESVNKLKSIDIDSLNESIQSLNDIVTPMAQLFGGKGGQSPKGANPTRHLRSRRSRGWPAGSVRRPQ
jgi:hypothetical protein